MTAISNFTSCYGSKSGLQTASYAILMYIMSPTLDTWPPYLGLAMCHESKVALMTALLGAWHVSWVLSWIHDLYCSEPDMCHESNLGPMTALPGPGNVLWVQGCTHDCASRGLTCVMGSNLNPWLLYTEPVWYVVPANMGWVLIVNPRLCLFTVVLYIFSITMV